MTAARRAAGMLSGTYIALLLLAGPVAAAASTARQSCDPAYGCPPSQPAQFQASCSLSATTASPGDAVTARIEHVAPGTQVTLTFDGAAVGDAVTDANGTAAINWRVPNDASTGDHSVVFVGQSVYCDASANGFRVVASESGGAVAPAGAGVSAGGTVGGAASGDVPGSASTAALAEGTVGAAAGRAPGGTGTKPSGSGGGGVAAVAVAVAATAGVAAIGGGAQAVRVLRRRRTRA